MATGVSGYFDLAGSNGFTARIFYEESYEISTNQSVVKITALQVKSSGYTGTTFYLGGSISVENAAVVSMDSGAGTHSFTLPGSLDTFTSVSGTPWASGGITHNNDGTKTVTVAVSLKGISAGGSVSFNISGTKSISLTSIPRVSSISAPNGQLGFPITLKIYRYSTSFRHEITYSCNGYEGPVASDFAGDELQWTLPTYLGETNTTGNSVTIFLTIETFSNGVSIGKSTTSFLGIIPDGVLPSVVWDIGDANDYERTYRGYIKNKSELRVSGTASGEWGSIVKNVRISCGSNSTTVNDSEFNVTFPLPTAGQIDVTVIVTDSRGRSYEDSRSITVLEYADPKVTAISAYRSDASGNADNRGSYMAVVFSAQITSLGGLNTESYTVRYRTAGSSSWASASASAFGYTVTNITKILSANTGASYEVQVVAKDAFSSVQSVIRLVLSGYALVHFDKGNNRIGLGKRAERNNALDVGLDIYMNDKRITGLPAPTENTEAAPKSYVDSAKTSAISTAQSNVRAYGLGGSCANPGGYDANKAVNTGFYNCEANTPNNKWWFITVTRHRDGSYITQMASYLFGSHLATRYSGDGGSTWSEWARINPANQVDVEYRTIEWFRDVAVYSKTVYVGFLPNATSMSVAHGCAATRILRVEGVLSNGQSMPTDKISAFYAGLDNIVIKTNANMSSYTAIVTLYYTKG